MTPGLIRLAITMPLLMCAFVSVPTAHGRQEASTPPALQEWTTYQRPAPPPDTLEQCFDDSHIIAAVTVEQADVVATRVRQEPLPTVRTIYRARVAELFKAGLSVQTGQIINVGREGGEYKDSRVHYRVANPTLPELKVGEQYILFLYWNKNEQLFRPIYGPEAIYRKVGETTIPLGRRTIQAATTNETGLAASLREIARTRPVR